MGMKYSNEHLDETTYIQVAENYYALRSEWLGKKMTDERRQLELCACVALRRESLMFTGQSACAIIGIPRLDSFELRPHCISDRTRRNELVRWNFGERDTAAKTVDGLLTASPIRIICDLAKFDSPESLLVSLNHCLFHKMFSKKQLAEELDKHPGMKGGKSLRRILKFATPKCESPLETIGLIALYNAGFAIPQQQVSIYDDDRRFVARVDMYWETGERKIVLELDGRMKYTGEDSSALYAEKERQDKLTDLKYEVIRANWHMVKDGRLIEKVAKSKIPMRRYHTKQFLCKNPEYIRLNQ